MTDEQRKIASSYTDSLCHDRIDAAVCRWIDEHIDYIGEPWWEWGDPGYIYIYYHWLGQSECIHVSVDEIKEEGGDHH